MFRWGSMGLAFLWGVVVCLVWVLCIGRGFAWAEIDGSTVLDGSTWSFRSQLRWIVDIGARSNSGALFKMEAQRLDGRLQRLRFEADTPR